METHARLLTAAAETLVADERQLLADLLAALHEFGASRSDQQTLRQSLASLDALFLLVVVGEFNAGKSAIINALLGRDVLREDVTPTTARITVVRFGEEASEPRVGDAGIAELSAPAELLRDLHIVDTPGTNAILREHETLTREFVPRADLVLFITSADRPFTESERTFLERIRDWGKKTVLVVNKIDILDTDEQRSSVVDYVAGNARTLLGVEPLVFPVSAKRAKTRGNVRAAPDTSGFDAFEHYLRTTLDEAERLRLKLQNPLGVAERLAQSLEADLSARRSSLDEDIEMLGQIERQVVVYGDDLRREFELRMSEIEKLLVEMEVRGHDHFDETIRVGRVFDLLNKPRMHQAFEQRVVADTPKRIDRKVSSLIDWLVDADFRQWQVIHELIAQRRAAQRERLGRMLQAGPFENDRSRLIESIGRDAEQIVETYDRAREADAIAEKARVAVATSAAIQVGAIGLGAVVAAVATTAAADMTGLAMAGVVATLGLLVIPNRRRQAKRELREKVTALKNRLSRALRTAFDAELQRSVERIRHHVEPYSQFVRGEQHHLDAARDRLTALRYRIEGLRERIAQLS